MNHPYFTDADYQDHVHRLLTDPQYQYHVKKMRTDPRYRRQQQQWQQEGHPNAFRPAAPAPTQQEMKDLAKAHLREKMPRTVDMVNRVRQNNPLRNRQQPQAGAQQQSAAQQRQEQQQQSQPEVRV